MCQYSTKLDCKISIIVPVYKVEQYVKRCVDSLTNQTYSNIEIILVDDGSPDNCPEICDMYQEQDSRIKVIHKENGGLSDARNKGLEVATGDYILFVDSDDEIILTAVEELAGIIMSYNADIVCFNAKEVLEKNKEEFISGFYSRLCTKQTTMFTYEEAIADNINRKHIRYEAWSKIYKKELIKQYKFPKGMLAEDFAIFYKILSGAEKIVHYDNQLYLYHLRNESIMGSKSEKLYFDVYNIEKEYYSEIKKLNLDDSDKRKAEDNYFKTLIKTYAKLNMKDYENVIKEIKEEIKQIEFDSLEKKNRILLLLYRVNKNIPKFLIRKFYKNL